MHEVAAVLAEAYFPASQVEHELSEVAPTTLLAFPASQSKHTAVDVAPDVPKYFPAGQMAHVPFQYAFRVPPIDPLPSGLMYVSMLLVPERDGVKRKG